MQRDGEEEEAQRSRDRLSKIRDPQEYQRAVADQSRNERRATYTQPVRVSWHEFLHHKGWTPKRVDRLADDYVYQEWVIYQLKVRYNQL